MKATTLISYFNAGFYFFMTSLAYIALSCYAISVNAFLLIPIFIGGLLTFVALRRSFVEAKERTHNFTVCPIPETRK